MPEYHLVEHAEVSPTCCFLCETTEGPFVRIGGVTRTRIASANGPVSVRGMVYICIGTDHNPGCLVQAARLAGMKKLSELHEDVQAAGREVVRLEAELAAARKENTTVRVVPVEEVVRELGRDRAEVVS